MGFGKTAQKVKDKILEIIGLDTPKKEDINSDTIIHKSDEQIMEDKNKEINKQIHRKHTRGY